MTVSDRIRTAFNQWFREWSPVLGICVLFGLFIFIAFFTDFWARDPRDRYRGVIDGRDMPTLIWARR